MNNDAQGCMGKRQKLCHRIFIKNKVTGVNNCKTNSPDTFWEKVTVCLRLLSQLRENNVTD